MAQQSLAEIDRSAVVNHGANDDLLKSLSSAASNPAVDATKLRELWDIMREIQDRDARRAYFRDFQLACSEMAPVVRDVEVKNSRDQVTNKYARLESIDRVIRPIYTKYGFALSYGGGADKTSINCRVIHREGHVEPYTLEGVMDATNQAKTALMAIGSTMTFLRRYLTALIFNLQFVNDSFDDDGRSGIQNLSESQFNQIQDLVLACEEYDKDSSVGLCRYLNVQSVHAIPAARFTEAVTALQNKLRSARKKAGA